MPYIYITLDEVNCLLDKTDLIIKTLLNLIEKKSGNKFFIETVYIEERKFLKIKKTLIYFLYVYNFNDSAECILNELRSGHILNPYYTYDELFSFLQGILFSYKLKNNIKDINN